VSTCTAVDEENCSLGGRKRYQTERCFGVVQQFAAGASNFGLEVGTPENLLK